MNDTSVRATVQGHGLSDNARVPKAVYDNVGSAQVKSTHGFRKGQMTIWADTAWTADEGRHYSSATNWLRMGTSR